MQIPLFVLLIIYGVGLIVWIIMTLFAVYQVVRYGTFTKVPLVVLFVYLLFCACIIGLTWFEVRDVDWTQTLDLSAPSIAVPTNIPSIFPTK